MKSRRYQRRPTSGTRSARTRWATGTDTNGTSQPGAEGTEPRAPRTGRAGHAGKQAPGHGGRPRAAARAGHVDHTLRTCPPTRTAAADAGENFACAELAMTPAKCHSQPTQCAYIGIWRGDAARPFEPLAAVRAGPPLPVADRLVEDHLRRAAVLVDAVRVGPDATIRPTSSSSTYAKIIVVDYA